MQIPFCKIKKDRNEIRSRLLKQDVEFPHSIFCFATNQKGIKYGNSETKYSFDPSVLKALTEEKAGKSTFYA